MKKKHTKASASTQHCTDLNFSMTIFSTVKENEALTFRFSKFLILCSITTIACLMGVLSTTSVEACFSSFGLAAEGILHGQQLELEWIYKNAQDSNQQRKRNLFCTLMRNAKANAGCYVGRIAKNHQHY